MADVTEEVVVYRIFFDVVEAAARVLLFHRSRYVCSPPYVLAKKATERIPSITLTPVPGVVIGMYTTRCLVFVPVKSVFWKSVVLPSI
jgi:hypothetical protein